MKIDIESLINKLEMFKKNKKMFIRSVDTTSVKNFLNGYRFGLTAANGWATNDPWYQIWEKSHRIRGWELGPTGSEQYMKEAGLDLDEIINELIEIEICFLREFSNTN